MAAFILVHGTFARRAAWTQPDSPLSLKLAEEAACYGEPVRLRPVPWSGKNLERDRVRAAAMIADEIRKCQTDYPGEAIFLVGHSHGGSSIAYFLKLDPELRDKIAGCAFLSTPFVALRLRPLWESWFFALLLSVGNAATFFVGLISFYLSITYLPNDRLVQFLLLALMLIVTGTISVLIAQRIFGSRIKESLRTTLLRRIAASETADLPSGHYLFLRATGDEAASLLGAGAFIGWSMARLSELFNGLILRARATLTTSNRYGSWALSFIKILLLVVMSTLYFIFSFLLAMAIAMVNADIPNDAWSMLNPMGLINEAMNKPADAPMIAIWLTLLSFTAGVAAYSLTIIGALLLSAFALRLFGWTSLLEAIFADFAVEPMPYGQNNFAHIDWKETGLDESGLNHSRTYLNPHALECLGAWIGKRLADGARIP